MLGKYATTAVRQSRELMVVLGYFMAYAAFFVVLAQTGEISGGLRVLQYVLLAVPLIYVLAVTASSIIEARGG